MTIAYFGREEKYRGTIGFRETQSTQHVHAPTEKRKIDVVHI